MSDVFKEQIIKRKATTVDMAKKAGVSGLVVVVFFVSAMFIPSMTVFITAAAVFGAYYLISFFNVEYEYAFTNGELDIDAIYNKTRRKRVYNGNVKDFELMAHVEDKNHIGDFSGVMEKKDFSTGVVGPNTYAFIASYKGKRTKFIIEPNEMMLQAFSTVLTPRKLFKKI